MFLINEKEKSKTIRNMILRAADLRATGSRPASVLHDSCLINFNNNYL